MTHSVVVLAAAAGSSTPQPLDYRTTKHTPPKWYQSRVVLFITGPPVISVKRVKLSILIRTVCGQCASRVMLPWTVARLVLDSLQTSHRRRPLDAHSISSTKADCWTPSLVPSLSVGLIKSNKNTCVEEYEIPEQPDQSAARRAAKRDHMRRRRSCETKETRPMLGGPQIAFGRNFVEVLKRLSRPRSDGLRREVGHSVVDNC